MRTTREVLDALPISAEAGLAPGAVAESRRRFGANRLTPLPRESPWKKFLAKFDEPIIRILLAAALLSMFVDLSADHPFAAGIALGAVALAAGLLALLRLSAGVPALMFVSALAVFFLDLVLPPHHASVEGLAVMVAVILATGVAFLSEYRSDREFEVLNAEKESLRAKVVRGGQFHTVPLEDVVVGDVVSLEMGDEVPADGWVLKAADFYVDESLMTGESEPVHKKPAAGERWDDINLSASRLSRGTQVADGVGQMLITEVGDETALGQLARHLVPQDGEGDALLSPGGAGGEDRLAQTTERIARKLTISKKLTPLQEKLKRLADLISKVGYTAAGLIFLALLARGLWKGEVFWPHGREDFSRVAGALLGYFLYVVIVIVVAVPEGLPMSVTVSLALGVRRMTREHSLVRQLVACETIGSATVICSDKTGTLTQNQMQVVRLSWDGKTFDPASVAPQAHGLQPVGMAPVDWIALNVAVNSTAQLEQGGRPVVVGNSTEGALLLWLHGAGIDYAPLRREFPLLFTAHFSSDRKRMTSVVRHGDSLVSLVKGAPEWVLEHAAHYQAADGGVRPWTPEAREAALAVVRDSSARAMRTLAFAYTELPPGTPADEDSLHARQDTLERDLVFVGVAALRDPLRDDVKSAVEECRRAGIDVKMITGDNVETARAIAGDIGLVAPGAAIDAPGAPVLTSAALGALDDGALKAHLPGLRVVARARPLDKYRLVKALQELGHVVAVTGDGTNDAPALKRADVGLAMGVAGTEVAKEASKIVLLDDAFSTIVKAVHWGRSLYENIQRFLQFQLTINLSALTIALLAPLFGVKPPFTVLQLLWINVIMDTLASLALCSEPPRPGVMRRPPRRRDENVLTRPMLATIVTTATFFVAVMMTLLAGMHWYGWFRGHGARSAEFPELSVRQVSLFFTAYVFFQVWNQVNCRSLAADESGLSGLGRNPTFLAVAVAVALVQVLIVSVPFLAGLFKVEPLGPADWLGVVAGTASVLLFAEAARRVRRALGTA
jgi:Ca2+-transporting ATPase